MGIWCSAQSWQQQPVMSGVKHHGATAVITGQSKCTHACGTGATARMASRCTHQHPGPHAPQSCTPRQHCCSNTPLAGIPAALALPPPALADLVAWAVLLFMRHPIPCPVLHAPVLPILSVELNHVIASNDARDEIRVVRSRHFRGRPRINLLILLHHISIHSRLVTRVRCRVF